VFSRNEWRIFAWFIVALLTVALTASALSWSDQGGFPTARTAASTPGVEQAQPIEAGG
jgi:hypothetical protein